jgi:hypothetical protein
MAYLKLRLRASIYNQNAVLDSVIKSAAVGINNLNVGSHIVREQQIANRLARSLLIC